MHQVGAGQVIKGWDEAFLDMKIGSKRILLVPPNVSCTYLIKVSNPSTRVFSPPSSSTSMLVCLYVRIRACGEVVERGTGLIKWRRIRNGRLLRGYMPACARGQGVSILFGVCVSGRMLYIYSKTRKRAFEVCAKTCNSM